MYYDLIIHVDDNDKGRLNLAFNNVANYKAGLPGEKFSIVMVANGPAIQLFTRENALRNLRSYLSSGQAIIVVLTFVKSAFPSIIALMSASPMMRLQPVKPYSRFLERSKPTNGVFSAGVIDSPSKRVTFHSPLSFSGVSPLTEEQEENAMATAAVATANVVGKSFIVFVLPVLEFITNCQ